MLSVIQKYIKTAIFDPVTEYIASVGSVGELKTTLYDSVTTFFARVGSAGDLRSTLYDSVSTFIASVGPNGELKTTLYDYVTGYFAKVGSKGEVSTAITDPTTGDQTSVGTEGELKTTPYDAVTQYFATIGSFGEISVAMTDPITGELSAVQTMTDDDHNIDGENAVLSASALYGRIDADIVKPIRADATTHTLQTIDYTHHEMHSGSHYFVKTFLVDTGGVDNTTYFAFTTPDSEVRIHAKTRIAADVDMEVNIYEDSVITGGGAITGRNNDRDAGDTPDLVIVAGPTHTTPGTVIWAARNGGGRNPVGVAPESTYEIIAKSNSVYVFELIKRTTADLVADVDFWWYEHAPKD